jgi:hypothetical protein
MLLNASLSFSSFLGFPSPGACLPPHTLLFLTFVFVCFFFLTRAGLDFVILLPQPQPPECWITGMNYMPGTISHLNTIYLDYIPLLPPFLNEKKKKINTKNYIFFLD